MYFILIFANLANKFAYELLSNPMGLMQVSVQFPGISVAILDVLYVVYIITSVLPNILNQ
jgi:hypothetical protein